MQKWWKNPRIIGVAAYWLMRGIKLTMRIRIVKSPEIDPNTVYLFAFWHGKQFLPSQVMMQQHNTPKCIMVSPSRDGAMLTVYLEKLGFEVVRASSRDGNVRGLLQIKRRLEDGFSLGFAVDGPIGPIHVVKPGMTYLAQKCNIKIIPIGSAFSSYWTFTKAWDKFELPKPLSKGVLVLGGPFPVTELEDLKQAALKLEGKMRQVEQEARSLL